MAPGRNPFSGLVQGTDGYLYGTTDAGGGSSEGVVFKISTVSPYAWTVLHSFAGGTTDGQVPYGPLVQGTDGNFYGMTYGGGANSLGTVYKITPGGIFTLLHSFAGGTSDGSTPYGGLVQGTDGNFYGMTYSGGAHSAGTVFQMTPSGTMSLLHSFAGGTTDGASPYGGLVQGTDGSLYGLTYLGGQGYGIAFKITYAGAFTKLTTFLAPTSGQSPYSGLVEGTDGNFYGTLEAGGSTGFGTIFQITPAGALTVEHTFSSTTGTSSYNGIIQGNNGVFYGLTRGGGASGKGTLWSLTPPTTFNAPVQLSASATTLDLGQSFTMSYSVYNSYAGTVAGTMNQCFESNTAGDTTWDSIVTATSTTATATVTPPAAGTYNYALTCGGVESSLVSITVNKLSTTAAMTSPTAAAPVTQTVGSLAAFPVSGTLAWASGSTTPPNDADISFTSTAAGSFGIVSCAGNTSPYTCSATFTPTSTDAAGSYNINLSFAGDTNYTSSASTVAGNYVISKQTPAVAVTSVSPSSEMAGSLSAVTVTATVTYTGNGATPTGTPTFSSSASGTFGAPSCGAPSGDVITCTVTFTPTSSDSAGSYYIVAGYAGDANYNGANNGTATNFNITSANTITFSSVTHNFGQIAVGTSTSGTSNYGVKLTNTAASAFAFGGITINGSSEFSSQTNCPATIAAGANCEIVFAFAPTASGTVSATWSVSSSSSGFSYSPSNGGTLSGSGTANGGVSLTSAGHNFGTVTVGQTSSTYGTELSNSTSSSETITVGPVPSGPFSMLTNCKTTLAAGSSCEIEFTFTPTSNSTVQVVVPLSGTPTAITSGGAVLPNGGITLTGN